jgi:hypothetical protein
MLVDTRLGPRGPTTTMSAVAARGTVEMLSVPERVKVSTDVPSQPLSSTAYQHLINPTMRYRKAVIYIAIFV